MKQLIKVVKKILTTVNSCQSAVKLDPQNLLDYTTLFHTKLYKIHQIILFSTYISLLGPCTKFLATVFFALAETWHKIELSAPKKNLLSTKPT